MIDKCRSCKSAKLKEIMSLGEQYLSDFVDDDSKPGKYPLDLVLCENCSLLQLREGPPLSALYTDRYGYRSGINKTMRDHLEGIADTVEKIATLSKGDVVIDIGCNDGTLLKSYKASGLVRVGYDPVGKFAREFEGSDILFINDYFNSKKFKTHCGSKKAKAITVISMFYDLEDPNVFIKDLYDIIDDQGVIVIQQNYLVEMLTENAFDNIVHEHLEYYSLLSMEHLLQRHGLMVFDVSVNNVNGGSFRTYICATGKRSVSDSILKMRGHERKMGLDWEKIYTEFAERIKNIKAELYALIESEVSKGKKVYLYGASTRGNTLLQYCGLDGNLIGKALERNPEKWGKKIASVGIPIVSEEEGRKDNPDYMLVLPWFFRQEFLDREASYLDGGGKFIFPLPRVEVVSRDSLPKK